ncbi:hypothetical protein V9T40_013738 [Parthenolecanium corni]|uniref:Uncharacterized protein n=1 Tax=Parthenolecanium corni TaxID=536013 RepID=A0AAN9Y2R5_9HEMI
MNNHVGNNIDHYGDGYMEQEEEWEREGLLDPAWEKQQKKIEGHHQFDDWVTFYPPKMPWKNMCKWSEIPAMCKA